MRKSPKGENMIEESQYFNQFLNERNLSKSTVKQYRTSLNQYAQFNNMSVDELIDEADAEEEKGIRLKKRTLKTRLVNFRSHIIQTDSQNTIQNKMTQVKAFYKHFEIEVPQLPYLSSKNIRKEAPISYDDIPTKTIIREALDFSNLMMRSFILLQCSSGMGKAEALSLTVGQFLESTGKNDPNKSIHDNLVDIYKSKEMIIPTFKMKRQKVNEYYYTFCTAEAVHEIVKMLLNERRELTCESKLFKVSSNYINTLMAQINDVLMLGTVNGQYRRFRSHMLRKFNATQLCNGENALSEEEIDFIQGRSRGKTRELYLKKNPVELKHRYIKAMNNVLINHESSVINQQIREIELNEDKLTKILELINQFDIDLEAL